MFITLLVATLVFGTCIVFLGMRYLCSPLRGVLHRIVGVDASEHWYRFAVFALFIASVACRVQVDRLVRSIRTTHEDEVMPPLTVEAWVYEIYQVIERTLEGLAWRDDQFHHWLRGDSCPASI